MVERKAVAEGSFRPDAPAMASDIRQELRAGAKSGVACPARRRLHTQMLDDVDTLVFDTDEASYLAECIRLRGQIAAGRGDVTRAAHLLETAIATAGRQQARLFELRAATQLAPVLARQGRAHEAATRLQAVVHTFNTRYSIVDLIAAQRALDTLGQ